MISKKINKLIWAVTSFAFVFLNSTKVFADPPVVGNVPTIPNPLGETKTIAGFITLLLDTLLPIASLLSIFFLIYSGFLMVMAGGNEEKLGKAKNAFLWTIIGIAVLLGAKLLSTVICGTISQLSTTKLSCVVK
jgi:hypothetical protein